jgi:ABC-2 type transport system ATP-binding protein
MFDLPMDAPVIETVNLTRTYGQRRGIEGVSLSIGPGSLYGFLGPNGAGKTTTIRVLLGFLRASGGSARVFGKDAWAESAAIKAEVGSIPGDLRLWGWMSGLRALRLFERIRGRPMLEHGQTLAEMFELDLSVRVRAISRGMRQKLGLILALAHKPRLLILDEPTSALDPLMQDRLRNHLRAVARAGSTVFFSSHTLGEVEALCERVAIVRAGRIVADATLDELRATARHEVRIDWRDGLGERVERPGFLNLSQQSAARWNGTLDGPVDPLIAWLVGKPIADVSITKPDLETLFRRYYDDAAVSVDENGGVERGEAGAGANGGGA